VCVRKVSEKTFFDGSKKKGGLFAFSVQFDSVDFLYVCKTMFQQIGGFLDVAGCSYGVFFFVEIEQVCIDHRARKVLREGLTLMMVGSLAWLRMRMARFRSEILFLVLRGISLNIVLFRLLSGGGFLAIAN
jgi:hypothetical protein